VTENENTEAAADEVAQPEVTRVGEYTDNPVTMPTDGPFGVEGLDEEVAAAQEARDAQSAATQEALTGDNPPTEAGTVAGAEEAPAEESSEESAE